MSENCWQVAVPRQEIINPVDGMIGDICQHVTQPSFGIDTVQLGRADQRLDRGGPFATADGAGDQIVAPTNGHTTQGAFGRRVVNLGGAVVAVAQQRRPELERLQNRRRRVGLARQRVERGAQPAFQVVEQWSRAGLPNLSSFVGRLAPGLGLDHIELGDSAQRLGG